MTVHGIDASRQDITGSLVSESAPGGLSAVGPVGNTSAAIELAITGTGSGADDSMDAGGVFGVASVAATDGCPARCAALILCVRDSMKRSNFFCPMAPEIR